MSFWDQYQTIKPAPQPVQEPISPIETQEQINVQVPEKNDYWGQYQTIKKPEVPETFGEKIGRNIAGTLATAFSSAVGLPGDIESFGRSLISGSQEGEGGLIGKISSESFLPTSSELKEKAKELHPELKPRNQVESLLQEIAGDYVFSPGGPLKKLAISAVSNLGKEAVKELGGGENAQLGAKVISGILASRIGKPNVKDFINKEYAKADAAIPKNATIGFKRSETYLNQVKEKVNEGGFASWKKPINDQIDALQKNFKDGKIKVTALNQSIKDIGHELMEKGIDPNAKMWLTRIKAAATHELKQYGKSNPKFMQHWKDANASFAGFKQSLIAQKAVDKFKEKGLFKGTVGLLAETLYRPEVAAKTGGILFTAYGVKKSAELMKRVFSNPVLANYYLKATAEAAKENAPQVIANLTKLDAELRKSNQNYRSKQ